MKLRVRVIPNAKSTGFTSRDQEEWVLRLNAPPVDGKANRVARDYIAEVLGLRRADVALVRGEKGRHKIFEIVGLDPSDVERRLAEFVR